MIEERTLRLFGVREETVRERLADVLACDGLSVALLSEDEDVHLHLTAKTCDVLEQAVTTVNERLGPYLYSDDGSSLEAQAVALLKAKRLTVATAESCTGGMIASRLTAVPGCSSVFGTGVVSYSWDCKMQLVGVSPQTLETCGAVSAHTAREMADGIRRQSGADIGIATTGEAGPQAAENVPVGTVYVALADKKRTWVKALHLDADRLDREGIRRVATSHALDLMRRYLLAYPTVMAGGERYRDYTEQPLVAAEPQTIGQRVLPWHGNRRSRFLKLTAWLSAFAVLVFGVLMIYNHILTPKTNRELQDDLADLYWDTTSDLTVEQPESDEYPIGMMSQFRSLYSINEDIAGWVRIADTPINYPVTIYADGYYNNHNFNDQFSVYGQPYFFQENVRDGLQTDRVLAIYGNNTRDEQMFSTLSSYRRIAFLRENPIIEMNTLFETAQWEIFAVALTDERERASGVEYMRQNFDDEAAFDEDIMQLRARSLFTSDASLDAEDKVLLLVTNVEREYGFNGARLVIAARRVTQTQAVTYTVNHRVQWPAAYAHKTTTRTTTTTTATTTTTTTTTTVTKTSQSTTETQDTEQSAPTTVPVADDDVSKGESNTEDEIFGDDTESEEESTASEDLAPEETASDDEVASESVITETNDDDYLGN